MPVKPNTRTRMMVWVDQITGSGLRLGITALAISAAFLLFGALSGKIQAIPQMPATERAQLTQVVEIASLVLVYACAVVVASLLIRIFRDEALGQGLTVAGAILFFGSPVFLVSVVGLGGKTGTALPRTVVDAFRTAGWICLVPGLVLLLRDSIIRIWNGLSVKRIIESRREGDEEPVKKSPFSSIYAKCWDMNFCRGFVRKVCPAYAARKSCWKIKIGCYCDEKTILKAMMSEGKENVHTRGIMKSLGIDETASKQAIGVRKQRCKKCGIYQEHQRQKYQLLSPVVFPVVAIFLYAFHEQISSVLWVVLQRTDAVMRFLAYNTGTTTQPFSNDGGIMIGLAFVWLTIMVVSYALRLLEYLIFELQV